MLVETAGIRRVIAPHHIPACLKEIFKPVIADYLDALAPTIAAAERRVAKSQFVGVMYLFDITALLHAKSQEMRDGLAAISDQTSPAKFFKNLTEVAETGKYALVSYLSTIHNDGHREVPPDGTVHQITSNTMNFLAIVNDYQQIAGQILYTRGGQSFEDQRQNLPSKPKVDSGSNGLTQLSPDLCSRAFVDWVVAAVKALIGNLVKKGKAYDVQPLASIFLINNYDHIQRALMHAEYAPLMKAFDVSRITATFTELIEGQKKTYLQTTWHKVSDACRADVPVTNMTQKEKEQIKEQYSLFNEALDEVTAKHRLYAVPHQVHEHCNRQGNGVFERMSMRRIFVELILLACFGISLRLFCCLHFTRTR
eukprot:m.779704 g.779704  ORF g.779704 m.779704 type:complete len:367 (+) comp59135_c0_seq7:1479-2579(+)